MLFFSWAHSLHASLNVRWWHGGGKYITQTTSVLCCAVLCDERRKETQSPMKKVWDFFCSSRSSPSWLNSINSTFYLVLAFYLNNKSFIEFVDARSLARLLAVMKWIKRHFDSDRFVCRRFQSNESHGNR